MFCMEILKPYLLKFVKTFFTDSFVTYKCKKPISFTVVATICLKMDMFKPKNDILFQRPLYMQVAPSDGTMNWSQKQSVTVKNEDSNDVFLY